MTSYELRVDDGQGGNFTSLIGGDSESLETQYQLTSVVAGTIYRFIYRARNVNGWSEFSEIAYIQASNVPARPPAPYAESISASSITLRVL